MMSNIKVSAFVFCATMAVCTSCTNSPTETLYSSDINGVWVGNEVDSIEVTNDSGEVVGKVQLTETYTMKFLEGGILKTTKNFEFSHKDSAVENSEYTYSGTWRVSNDTLYRDANPGVLFSQDTSKYSINYNDLTLTPIGATKQKTFVRIK